MKDKQIDGHYGMVEASKKEINYFESFDGEAVDIKKIITQSKTKKPVSPPKKASVRR